jgi:hypothetical protein
VLTSACYQEVNPEGKAMVEFHDGDTELVDLLHERYCLSAGPSLRSALEPNRGSASLRFCFLLRRSFLSLCLCAWPPTPRARGTPLRGAFEPRVKK